MDKIFLDNNGTTQTDPRVISTIVDELEIGPSNPSSIHQFGRAARLRLNGARESISHYFKKEPNELIFTSSGTEALNMALLGIPFHGEIITSKIEHPAIQNTLTRLNNPIHYLPVGQEGHILCDDLKKAITSKTGLIVLGAVNGETGVKNPLEEIAAIADAYHIPLIVDGVAWLGKEKVFIPKGVTAMAFSGHKIHAPKGIGLLFLERNCRLSPLLTGGGQETMRRGGTENLPGIIGLAKAIEILEEELPEAMLRIQSLRDHLEANLENAHVNGTGSRVCNTSNVTFPGVDGEALFIQLDLEGIATSMGSACSSGAREPSKVLLNMGISKENALSTLRFSLSRFTTREEIEKTITQTNALLKCLSY